MTSSGLLVAGIYGFIPRRRGVRYKRYRKNTDVNLRYGMDFDVTMGPVDSVVCNVLQSNATTFSCKKLRVTTEKTVTLT